MNRHVGVSSEGQSIGIEKGKSFNPDAKTEAILDSASAEVHA
jgi:hypothetical protein